MKLLNRLRTSEKLIFLLVGACAAAVHECVMILLVEGFSIKPVLANWIGFIVAFIFSYFGHKTFTFKYNLTVGKSIFKFFIVALLSFLCNYIIFSFLLYFTSVPYYIALPIALLIVAVLTFYLSRQWVFKK
jgi:putative flippase GtrA